MGSEMCIRDRSGSAGALDTLSFYQACRAHLTAEGLLAVNLLGRSCLLYTSDAADERSSVDLGGRRIIKKKKRVGHRDACVIIDMM